MKKYKTTIGMEVHVELATKSKMFCPCKNGMGLEKKPNKNTCPVCTAQPGALPVPNEKAIEYVIKAGLALNCKIANETKFDRKNYFYPDLPKGYQISQYDQPICEQGKLELDIKSDKERCKKVGITRIHLEEDTGKSIHQSGTKESLIDFNRAGVPLMELVTEPDIENSKQAKNFCEKLRTLFRYLGISSADMEKGQMRCEANISLYEDGENLLSGTKVELKNLNSFKAVERGIEFEIKRQSEILEKGDKVIQETRGWSEKKQETFAQRIKEGSDDYRYFPEPDILPLIISQEKISEIKSQLGENPERKKERFINQFKLKKENAEILVRNKDFANYYENAVSELENWMNEEGVEFKKNGYEKLYQLAANYMLTEFSKHLIDTNQTINNTKVTPENFAEFVKIIFKGEINSSAAQIVLEEMFLKGSDPSHVIEEKNLGQSSDENELKSMVQKVIKSNKASVEDYKKGKENALQFLMGQVMSMTKGRANPRITIKILKEELK